MTKNDIYELISSLPDTRIVNDEEICMRCFLCGDSEKNLNKKRLYFKINRRDPKEPILYRCFNCYQSGILTSELIKEMGIVDIDTIGYINKLNHTALHDDGSRVNRYRNTKEIKVGIPKLQNTPDTIRKIKYLYDRIGFKIPLEDFDRLKVITNLGEFLQYNDIPHDNPRVKLLSDCYVGFLSIKNEYVILRDITGVQKFRYVKYNIFDIVDNTQCFYAPRASIDLLSQEDIHIVVAEGPFDILGIIYNIYNGNFDEKIFIASCDGSFVNPIMEFIRKGLVGDNIFIDCYQDNDTRLRFKDIKRKMKLYTPNFTVYYNRLSKDFGVPKSMIDKDILLL